jgi:hypothetical protein
MSEELTPWQKYKQNLGKTTPLDLINPNKPKALSEKAQSRLNICKSCPELTKLTIQCKKCGCFMAAKVKLDEATCPLGKW